jgi:threonine synthase
MHLAATREGMFVSPESGAAFIAAQNLRRTGFLQSADETVIFSTGAGLKHTDLVGGESPVIDPNAANLAGAIDAALAG